MRKIIYYILILFVVIWNGKAQRKADQDSIFNQKVILEREYNPIIKDATRIELLPLVSDPKIEKSPIQYQFSNVETAIPTQWKTLLPEKKMGTQLYSTQRGFVDLGLGLPSNSLCNAGIILLNDAVNKLNLTFDHRLINDSRRIAQTNETQTVFSTDNRLGGSLSHHFDPFLLDVSVAYGYSSFNYFGQIQTINPLTPSVFSSNNQIQNSLYLNGTLKSYETSELAYTGSLKYSIFDKKQSASIEMEGPTEYNIILEGEISKAYSEFARIGLEASINNFIYKTDSKEVKTNYSPESYGVIELTPHYDWKDEIYKVRIGLRSIFEFSDQTHLFLAPSISGEWEFTPRYYLIGSLGGGTHKYSFTETDNLYRYLNPAFRLKDTYTPIDLNLSVKSNLYPRLNVELTTGYESGKAYYFVGESTHSWRNVLTPAALIKTNHFKIGVIAQYNIAKIGDIQLKLMKHQYSLDGNSLDQSKAWNKPAFEMNLDGNFTVNEKINVQMNYYLATGRYGAVANGATNYDLQKMNAINQLNLGSRYLINHKWSTFLQLNNILLQKYDLWYGMPAQNFNFVVGVGFSY